MKNNHSSNLATKETNPFSTSIQQSFYGLREYCCRCTLWDRSSGLNSLSPSIVHDEMYSVRCDVIFVNLFLYINTMDVLILCETYSLNHPCCLTNERKMHFSGGQTVTDVPSCCWYTFVHAPVRGKTSILIKMILSLYIFPCSLPIPAKGLVFPRELINNGNQCWCWLIYLRALYVINAAVF